MSKIYFYQRIVFTFAVFTLLCIGFYAYAWTDPGQAPPGGGAPALIDSGAAAQTKTGGLNILGNVGIGTTTPSQMLHIFGTAGNPGLIVQDTNGGGSIQVKNNSGDAWSFQSALNGNLNIFESTSSVHLLIEKTSGNVGIGTTGPLGILHLQKNQNNATTQYIQNSQAGANASARLYVWSDSAGAILTAFSGSNTESPQFADRSQLLADANTAGLDLVTSASAGDMRFYTGGSVTSKERMRIDSSGNVGIGTTGPAFRLSIAGGYQTSGLIHAASQIHFGATGASPNAGQIVFGDNTGWKLHFGTRVAGTFTERMTIMDTGNVGIGTASPNTVLDINGALSVRAMTAPALSSAVQGRIYFDSAANKFKVSENGGAYQDLVGGAGGGFWTDQGTYIYPNNYNQLAITDAGKVGIGITSPTSPLHVNAPTGQYANDGSKPTMILSYAGTTYANHYIGGSWDYFIDNPYNSTSNGGIHIKTAGIERLTISKNGNIGIGTASPVAKLDINGAIKANNHLTHLPWKNFADPPNGYIKLSTPIVHNESNMFSLRIFGYEYTGGSDPIDIQCVGYAYSATTLISARCQTEGTDLAVEMGTETRPDQGGKTVVVIRLGTPTWDWYYPQLTVEYIGWKAKNEADFKWVTGETTPVQTGNTNNVVINDQTGNSWFNTSGNVGIGTTSPQQKLEISGGLRLNTSAAKPACSANSRGTIWFTQAGAGVKDAVEICAKDTANAYAWRSVW